MPVIGFDSAPSPSQMRSLNNIYQDLLRENNSGGRATGNAGSRMRGGPCQRAMFRALSPNCVGGGGSRNLAGMPRLPFSTGSGPDEAASRPERAIVSATPRPRNPSWALPPPRSRRAPPSPGIGRPHRPDQRPERVSSMVTALKDMASTSGNKKSYPPPPPRSQNKIDAMAKNASDAATYGSTSSSSSSSAASWMSCPPKHRPSPTSTCVALVPRASNSSNKLDNLRQPPPPPPSRHSRDMVKYAPPPPRANAGSSRDLALRLGNSRILPLPLYQPISASAHSISGRDATGSYPRETKKSQPYSPPPRAGRLAPDALSASGKAPPESRKSATVSGRNDQQNASERAKNNESSITLFDDINQWVAAVAATLEDGPENLSASRAEGGTSPNSRAPSAMTMEEEGMEEERLDFCGYRPDYALGERARSPSHTVTELNPKRAAEAVSALSNHDYAFVKRSDGWFYYSILAFRSDGGGDDDGSNLSEECMTFVVSKSGKTKTIKRSRWGESVRLASKDDTIREEVPRTSAVASSSTSIHRGESHRHEGSRRSDDEGCDREEKPNGGGEDDEFAKLRAEMYIAQGLWLPDAVTFDSEWEEDDCVSCISASSARAEHPETTAMYTPSQPAQRTDL